jgi:hypothetical protein
MFRLLCDFRNLLWRVSILPVVSTLYFALMGFSAQGHSRWKAVYEPVVFTCWVYAVTGWHFRREFRLIRQARHYRREAGTGAVLWWSPPGPAGASVQHLRLTCELELNDLERQFGFRLPRPVLVMLVPGTGEIQAVLGREAEGYAIPVANAIVLARGCDKDTLVRHELVHLFTIRWNPFALPLLDEGLAVWLQHPEGGAPVDWEAAWLLRPRPVRLTPLLPSKAFHNPSREHAHYVLAGSFTGFLLRRFGWKRYRAIYRTATARRFPALFAKHFGLALEEAERRWRDEILATASLRRRLDADLSS